ncbi:MAG TPA: amidohydrolase family protein [Streptosporangiaceae bacterium]
MAGRAAVTGGTVITPDGPRQADVLISNGVIAGIGRAGPDDVPVVDAAGCYVLPGGVDPHTHLMSDVPRATAAAAAGGTTTVLSFTNPDPGQGDLDSLLARRAELASLPATADVGLHAMIYAPDLVTEADLAAALAAGASAIKIFLAYPELGIMCSPSRLLELMTLARRLGLLVQVHCENGPLIETLVEHAVQAAGPQARPGAARLFADTRPAEVEEEAVASTLAIASLAQAPCYLVHLSSAGAIEQVRLARKRARAPVYAETCLHHLLLDDRSYAGPEPGRYLVAPPLRDASHAEALWAAVADGTIDTVGSDHCQTRSAVTGGLAAVAGDCAYGIAGVGARLPLLLSEGLARDIPLTRLARLAAENPARIFGHYPAKGALAPGSDADVVVYDPDGEAPISGDAFDDGTGPTIYAGGTQRGRIRAVLLRGELVAADGQPTGARPGRYRPAGDPRPAGQRLRGEDQTKGVAAASQPGALGSSPP